MYNVACYLNTAKQEPMLSTTTPTLKPSPPDQTVTFIPLPTLLDGITTPVDRPSMTPNTPVERPSMSPNTPGQPTTSSMEPLDAKLIAITVSTVFVVLLIIVLLSGCTGCIIVYGRSNSSAAQKVRREAMANKMEKGVCDMIEELSHDEAKKSETGGGCNR